MKTIFLDRDGVINRYPGDRMYVTSLKKFRFLPRVKEAIALLTEAGYKVFVASNQAGVGRRIYSQATLDRITLKMLKAVQEQGGKIDKVYYCTHRKESGCLCRKPRPGLLKAAAKEFKFNLKNSYFVGDTVRDIFTAKNAGCKSILVLSGKEKLSNRKHWQSEPDFVFHDLLAAAKFLIRKK